MNQTSPIAAAASGRSRHSRHSRNTLAAFGFLLPNFLGFVVFTLFPVFFSLWMVFTNWSLKPAVQFQYLGLRNIADLLGVRALQPGSASGGVALLYGGAALGLLIGLFTTLWAAVSRWPGIRLGGLLLLLLGLVLSAGGPNLVLPGLFFLICGGAIALREGEGWRPGAGTLPVICLIAACAGIALLNGAMWKSYEPRDPRFWQYLYNTIYLMLGIPFSIGGSLALALLLSDDLPLGNGRIRGIGATLCVLLGLLTLIVIGGLGNINLALIAALFWLVAALGFAFNVVAFRTLFYLPSFTAGVALMILWKALYNPQTGPINVALTGFFQIFGLQITPPEWLASVEWAKPALILMGVWIGIGGTNMLLYLAGLSNVPKELLDAASVDGASGWQRFRHVTWPQLAPTTFFITIMAIIGGLQGGFEQARVMTQGGPAGATTTLSYYIYNKAFQDLDLGYAATISWVLFVIVFAATAINWRFGREIEVE